MHGQRRRTDLPRPSRARPAMGPVEALEGRQLLSTLSISGGGYYHPSYLPPRTVSHERDAVAFNHPYGSDPRTLSFLDNDGKVLTGRDRDGDTWTITVHGPGAVIVNDVTPNDGVLDDEINTIQLVGTNLRKTYVTGQVTASGLGPTDGIMRFSRLLAPTGAASIILNGFTLSRSLTPPPETGTPNDYEIFIPGGVQTLSFHNIEVANPTEGGQSIDVVIGDPTTPLPRKVQPYIKLDSIWNTVADAAVSPFAAPDPTLSLTPQTFPTVNIIVNGVMHGLDIVSVTYGTIQGGDQFFDPPPFSTSDTQDKTAATIPAALKYLYPTVSTQGRTAVRAQAIRNLRAQGSVRNLTASRAATPFQNGTSGLKSLKHAQFGGNADGVGLNVNGPIGSLKFNKGLGSPVGVLGGTTESGIPRDEYGYPANNLLGGQVTASSIDSLEVAPANTVLQTSQDPTKIQLIRTNSTRYYARNGDALNSAAITTSGSIGKTTIVGNSRGSDIHTGFSYQAFASGLEPTRKTNSRLGPLHHRGDLIDSVISSSYGPVDDTFGNGNDQPGNGTIKGRLSGIRFEGGKATALGYQGQGIFARNKSSDLPPPDKTTRVHGVLTR